MGGRPSRGEGVFASDRAIWFFAAMYFSCYVPFTGMTKALSKGIWYGQDAPVSGVALLPVSTMASVVVMLIFLGATGWWRSAHLTEVGRWRLPIPTVWTALSGVCTSLILTTTTLAYTFDGVSIVFVMLLMRGGVLIIAPVVDALSGRQTHWYSWVALGLSMSALLVAFSKSSSYDMTLLCTVDIAVYLAAYFVRFRFMSRLAKSDDPEVNKRYFVEEQLIVAPFTLLVLGALALWGQGTFMESLRVGFTDHIGSSLVFETALIGTFSQLVGIFGTLIFLDRRENAFAVPVNRCASILAGVCAAFALHGLFGTALPGPHQLVGVGLVFAAIVVLSTAKERGPGKGS